MRFCVPCVVYQQLPGKCVLIIGVKPFQSLLCSTCENDISTYGVRCRYGACKVQREKAIVDSLCQAAEENIPMCFEVVHLRTPRATR